ncbi:hypothetical protein [Pseudomonas sp. dw_358]|uniref:hypothetical protein n=1 Tax=Pseudomonas sp. dw_358 TaxID=2720083 RepID=UPI001BD44E52|nr:hypothetical protein [Pseudomonas sp. dw_358]
MDPSELISQAPTTLAGWVSWGLCVLFGVSVYLSKYLSERRADNKEIHRLEKALAEERTLRKEADAENRSLSDRINDLVQTFSDQNATNARLEEQMKHLAEQNDQLRQQVARLQQTVQGTLES